MIRFLFLSIILFNVQSIWAVEIDTNLFCYDRQKVELELQELINLEKFINENPQVSNEEIIKTYPDLNKRNSFSISSPYNIAESAAPGGFSSFWFTFLFSAVGTYFLYGAVAGPISVGIVYFASHKSKSETKKAIWGWIAGTLVGLGLWATFHML